MFEGLRMKGHVLHVSLRVAVNLGCVNKIDRMWLKMVFDGMQTQELGNRVRHAACSSIILRPRHRYLCLTTWVGMNGIPWDTGQLSYITVRLLLSLKKLLSVSSLIFTVKKNKKKTCFVNTYEISQAVHDCPSS